MTDTDELRDNFGHLKFLIWSDEKEWDDYGYDGNHTVYFNALLNDFYDLGDTHIDTTENDRNIKHKKLFFVDL